MKYLATIIIALILTTSFVFASNDTIQEKYTVVPTILNIRNSPSINSDIIGKLNKNDTIVGIEENEDWLRITIGNDSGYISSEYVTELKKPGFKAGFLDGFQSVFLYILIGIAAIIHLSSKRVKDSRFKSGYRELPFTTFEILKIALYSLIISSLIGLVSGIINLLKTL